MNKREHKGQGKERKAIQAKQDEEQRSDKNPAEAISRLSANIARSGDIQALQRTIGNRVVSNMIQRHGRYALANYDFRIRPLEGGSANWLRGESEEHE